MSKTLVVYKSVSGFTQAYAEAVAEAVGGEAVSLRKFRVDMLDGCHRVVFGGRLHAGSVDGLKKFRQLLDQNAPARFLVFAVGAMPDQEESREDIRKMWEMNLGEDGNKIPHFYMQGGLRMEKLPILERLMIKAFASMLKKKKDQSEYDRQAAEAMSSSFDASSLSYIQPLVDALNEA